MYRVFHTKGDVHELNVTWSRYPSELNDSAGRYNVNISFPSSSSLKASITLVDLKLFPDYGSYTVEACSNCTCENTTFVLYLFECDPEKVPQPVALKQTTVIAETSLPSILTLYMVFMEGDDQTFFYTTSWGLGSWEVCHEPNTTSHTYRCTRTHIGNCSFTANLFVLNPTHESSGNYTVQAIGSGDSSRIATDELGEGPTQ
jgi:hypothetical protein